MRLSPAALAEDFYRHAKDVHLDGFAPLELTEAQEADAFLAIDAPTNTRALAAVDPALIARAAGPVRRSRRRGWRGAGAGRCGRRRRSPSRPG